MFDKRTLRGLHWAIGFILCSYILRLGLQNQLNLYIHPRYNLFALCMAAFGLLLCGVGLIMSRQQPHSHDHKKAKEHFGFLDLILIVLILCTIFIEPKPLLSATADQRKSQKYISATSLQAATSFQPKSLIDWSYAIYSSPNPAIYNGREVDIIGFVYQPKDQQVAPDKVYIARFQVSCCAVDASLVTIPISYPAWESRLKRDSWVRVRGTLSAIDDEEPWQVVATHADYITQPQDPYEYTIPQ